MKLTIDIPDHVAQAVEASLPHDKVPTQIDADTVQIGPRHKTLDSWAVAKLIEAAQPALAEFDPLAKQLRQEIEEKKLLLAERAKGVTR
jgi:hypothetical protein